MEGFRYELLGRDLEAIQEGRAAIAFEGEKLKLIALDPSYQARSPS